MFDFLRMNNVTVLTPTMKHIPSKAGVTYTVGEALSLSSGNAVVATGTTKPDYICACNYVAPATGNEDIAVYEVNSNMEFKVPFDADGTAVAVGDKVTIGAAGLTITATTTGGVAEVLSKYGSGAAGTYASVKF